MTFRDFEKYLRETGLHEDLSRICKNHFVKLKDVYGPERSRSVSRARAACWEWMSENANRSALEIGSLWGRDSTTVYHALKRHRAKV